MPKNTGSLRKAIQNDSDKMRTIDMQVDTVSAEGSKGRAAYFTGGNSNDNRNTITVNYVKNKGIARDVISDYSIEETVLLHEQKHRDNYLQGIYAYAVSPEQAYKRTMHDEISANMTELVALRDEYIETGNISVFDKEPKFGFYKEAIERGEINPNSPYKEDFDKDMSLIVNGTQKMWQEYYACTDMYTNIGLWHMQYGSDAEGKYKAFWDENYKNSLKIAYNIGGVDFTKYMDKDAEIPHEAYEQMKDFDSSQSHTLSDAEIFQKSGLPAYDGSISLSEYKKLLQHKMALDSAFSSQWYEDRELNTQEFLQYLHSDKFKDYMQSMYDSYPEFHKKYPTIDSFIDEEVSANKCYLHDKLQQVNESYINKIVEYQAQEYAKTGKEFPADNKENYQKKLNDLYCGTYDLIGLEDNQINSTISAKANDTVKQSQEGFADKVKRGLENLQYRCTHITDKDGETHEVGVWGKIVHKLGEVKESVGNWMTGHDPNISKNNNLPTSPVNSTDPEYRQWENKDGYRVSEVQYRQILDMNQAIIVQPTRSYAAENDANSAMIIPMDKTQVVEQIRKDQYNAQILEQNRAREIQLSQQTRTAVENPLQAANARSNQLNTNFRRNMKQHGF